MILPEVLKVQNTILCHSHDDALQSFRTGEMLVNCIHLWVVRAGFLHKHWIGGLFQTSKILWSVHPWDSKCRPQIYFRKSTSTVYEKCYQVVSFFLYLSHKFSLCTHVEHRPHMRVRNICTCLLKQLFVTFQVHQGWNFGRGPLLERHWSTYRWIRERTKEEQVRGNRNRSTYTVTSLIDVVHWWCGLLHR